MINYLDKSFGLVIRLEYLWAILLFSIAPLTLFAQAGEAGNFDIRGNVYSGSPNSNVDDWFQGPSGLGLINESNTATHLATTQSLSNTPFLEEANHAQYETINGSLQYQSIYARDYVNFNNIVSGNYDQTIFEGGDKNGQNIQADWGIINGTILEKNDLVDNYIHLRRAGLAVDAPMWLTMGLSTLGSNGNHFIDFELIASDLVIDGTGGGFANSGNEEGHNAWMFDTGGNIIKTGDLIVGFAFSGPTVSNIEVRIWVSRDFYENGTPAGFTFGPEFDGSGTNSIYGYAQVNIPTGGFYGSGNPSNVTGPPWQTFNEQTNPLTSVYGPGQLAEVGVDLSAIGIDPATTGGNPCDAPFIKVMVKSRSSASFTAQLKDFAGPYEFLGTPIIDTDFTPDTFSCTKPVIELKPDIVAGIAFYTWSTLDGNFISTNTDTSHVLIDRPGTYILGAAPLEGCDLTYDTMIVIAKPCATNDINQTLTNTSVSGSVATNDTSPPGTVFTVNTIPLDPPDNGSITMNADGSYTYTPNAGFVGTDSIVYEICINAYSPPTCDTAVLVIEVRENITQSNDPPIAENDETITEVDNPVSSCLICNDSDPDGNNLIVNTTPVTSPTNGTVTIDANGNYTYTPNPGFVGTDEFTYVVCDDGIPTLCDTATVTILITDPNPLNETHAFDDAASVPEDGSVTDSVLGNDIDPEGDTQAGNVTLVSGVSNGTLVLNLDGTYTYTPTPDYSGPDQFVYSVCDNGTPQACDTATVYLTVFPLGPIAENDINQTLINTPVSGDLVTNDTDGDNDVLTVNTTPISGPSNGSIILNTDGTYIYTPNPGFVGTDQITYEVCDNTSPTPLCDIAVLVIEVRANGTIFNDPPIAQNDESVTEAGTAVTSCLICNDSDPDGNNLTVNTTPVTTPTNGTVTIDANGNYTYTPNPGFVGTDEFTYVVCDDGTPSLCDTATVTITITEPNPANETYAFDDAASVLEDGSVMGNVLGNDIDPEGDTQSGNVTLVNGVSNGTLVLNPDGSYTYTPNPDYSGPDQFTYSVCDTGIPQVCDTATVYLTVFPQGPIAKNDINQTESGSPVSGNLVSNDTDGDTDPLTVNTTPVSGPSNGTIVINPDGTYTYTPNPGFIGTETIEYEVCDNTSPTPICDTAVLVIEVVANPLTTPGNNPPDANDDTNTVEAGGTVTSVVLSNDHDPDGDPVSVTQATGLDAGGSPIILTNTPQDVYDANGQLAGQASIDGSGNIIFTADPNFVGDVPIDYTLTDGEGGTDQATLVISVEQTNPTDNDTYANDDANIGLQGDPQSGNILTNDYDPEGNTQSLSMIDTDGDGILDTPVNLFSYTITQDGVVIGSLLLNASTGAYIWQPEQGFVGTAVIAYEVCDNGTPQTCETATLYLTTLNCGSLVINVFLEGPYNTASGNMITRLNEFHLLPGMDPTESSHSGPQSMGVPTPAGHPYDVAPWNYGGAEGDDYGDLSTNPMATKTYKSTVSDWILVSVRVTDSLATSTIWKCAALLNMDGSVEFPDECPCVDFSTARKFYVLIEHRNHLPIMSNALSPINNQLSIDFTQNQSWIWEPVPGTKVGFGQKAMGGGIFAMFAANGDHIPGDSDRRDINSADDGIWLIDNGIRFKYQYGDFNHDADPNAADNGLWIGNNAIRSFINFLPND